MANWGHISIRIQKSYALQTHLSPAIMTALSPPQIFLQEM